MFEPSRLISQYGSRSVAAGGVPGWYIGKKLEVPATIVGSYRFPAAA